MKLDQAKKYAAKIIGKLSPYCRRIELAGDMRLARETVKEIIIVCIPDQELQPYQLNLLPGEAIEKVKVRSSKFIEVLKREYGITGTGRENRIRTRIATLPVTIYTANEDNFGLQLVMNTGPIKFLQLLQSSLQDQHLTIHQNELYKAGKKLNCSTEEQLFKHAGMKNWPLPHRVHYHDFAAGRPGAGAAASRVVEFAPMFNQE